MKNKFIYIYIKIRRVFYINTEINALTKRNGMVERMNERASEWVSVCVCIEQGRFVHYCLLWWFLYSNSQLFHTYFRARSVHVLYGWNERYGERHCTLSVTDTMTKYTQTNAPPPRVHTHGIQLNFTPPIYLCVSDGIQWRINVNKLCRWPVLCVCVF